MSDQLIFYGLKSCDSCRKARRWLDDHQVQYELRDVREQPPTTSELTTWCDQLGWERLVNRRSTTWRQLPESSRQLTGASAAIALLQANPTLLKRPVMITPKELLIGFTENEYERQFSNE